MDNNEIHIKLNMINEEFMNLSKNSSKEKKRRILNMIDDILRADPLNLDAYKAKATYYEAITDYPNAVYTYKQILIIDPTNEFATEGLENCTKIKRGNVAYSGTRNFNLKLLENLPKEWILGGKVFLLVVIFAFVFNIMMNTSNDSIVSDFKPHETDSFESLTVNEPSEYDYLTKEEIYNIRKSYVSQSIFANDNYEPSDTVFGQIVSRKPWWGSASCGILNYEGDYHERVNGTSKVSVQMNNPNALVGLSMPYLPWETEENMEFCTERYSRLIPTSIKYNKKEKLIVATYNLTRNFLNFRSSINGETHRYPIQLSGLNARDFGYNYVYAFDRKNIKMMYSDNNITNNVEAFRDFVHLGGSCKYQDGCNNISPMQNDKMIKVTELPAEISLKLWKRKPLNENSKADMYYKIIFEEE